MRVVSLARLVYETKRSLQGKAHQVEKKRGGYGDFKSGYPRTQTRVRRSKKTDQGSRQRRRTSGEISEQSLVEEIKGTGIHGLDESAESRERARKRFEELSRGAAGGLSGLVTDAASKRAAQDTGM